MYMLSGDMAEGYTIPDCDHEVARLLQEEEDLRREKEDQLLAKLYQDQSADDAETVHSPSPVAELPQKIPVKTYPPVSPPQGDNCETIDALLASALQEQLDLEYALKLAEDENVKSGKDYEEEHAKYNKECQGSSSNHQARGARNRGRNSGGSRAGQWNGRQTNGWDKEHNGEGEDSQGRTETDGAGIRPRGLRGDNRGRDYVGRQRNTNSSQRSRGTGARGQGRGGNHRNNLTARRDNNNSVRRDGNQHTRNVGTSVENGVSMATRLQERDQRNREAQAAEPGIEWAELQGRPVNNNMADIFPFPLAFADSLPFLRTVGFDTADDDLNDPDLPPEFRVVNTDVDPDDYEGMWELAERLGEVKKRGLEEEKLERLPTQVFKDSSNKCSTQTESAKTSCGDDENKLCKVCLCEFDPGESLRTLPCMHIYHKACIDEWLTRNAICPVCRKEVKV